MVLKNEIFTKTGRKDQDEINIYGKNMKTDNIHEVHILH